MLNIGNTVKVKHNNKIAAIIAIEENDTAPRYVVLVDGKKNSFYEEQIEPFNIDNSYLS